MEHSAVGGDAGARGVPKRPPWIAAALAVLAALGLTVLVWIVAGALFAGARVPLSFADDGGSRTPGVWLRAGQAGAVLAVLGLPVALSAVLLRFTRAPRPGARRLLRPAVALPLALVALALLAATFSYGPLHPLSATFELRSTSSWTIVAKPRDRDPRTLDFLLANDHDDEPVLLRSVRVAGLPAGAAAPVESAYVHETARGERIGRYGPTAGIPLDHGSLLLLRARLSPAACASPQRSYRVTRVEARFETLGVERTQRFDVAPPAVLSCR